MLHFEGVCADSWVDESLPASWLPLEQLDRLAQIWWLREKARSLQFSSEYADAIAESRYQFKRTLSVKLSILKF